MLVCRGDHYDCIGWQPPGVGAAAARGTSRFVFNVLGHADYPNQEWMRAAGMAVARQHLDDQLQIKPARPHRKERAKTADPKKGQERLNQRLSEMVHAILIQLPSWNPCPKPESVSALAFLQQQLRSVHSDHLPARSRDPDTEHIRALRQLTRPFHDVHFEEWGAAAFEGWIREQTSADRIAMYFPALYRAGSECIVETHSQHASNELDVQTAIRNDVLAPLVALSDRHIHIQPGGGRFASPPPSGTDAADAAPSPSPLAAMAPGVSLKDQWHSVCGSLGLDAPAASTSLHEYLSARIHTARVVSDEAGSSSPSLSVRVSPLLSEQLSAQRLTMDTFIQVTTSKGLEFQLRHQPLQRDDEDRTASLAQLMGDKSGLAALVQMLHSAFLCRSWHISQVAYGALSSHTHTLLVQLTVFHDVLGRSCIRVRCSPTLTEPQAEPAPAQTGSAIGAPVVRRVRIALLCMMIAAAQAAGMRINTAAEERANSGPAAGESEMEGEPSGALMCGTVGDALPAGPKPGALSFAALFRTSAVDVQLLVQRALSSSSSSSRLAALLASFSTVGHGQCGSVLRIGDFAVKLWTPDSEWSCEQVDGLLHTEIGAYRALRESPFAARALLPVHFAGHAQIGSADSTESAELSESTVPVLVLSLAECDLLSIIEQRRIPAGLPPLHHASAHSSMGSCACLWCQSLDCLRALHSAGWLHGDLRPDNFVWHAASRSLRIIDLGHATHSRETREHAKEIVAWTDRWQLYMGDRQ
jgi:hypothetical protein